MTCVNCRVLPSVNHTPYCHLCLDTKVETVKEKLRPQLTLALPDSDVVFYSTPTLGMIHKATKDITAHRSEIIRKHEFSNYE